MEYGKIKYSSEYETEKGMLTHVSDITTDLYAGTIASNGDCQKSWIKTLRGAFKKEGLSVRGYKNLTWISWTADTIRNDERYVVEYTKVNIGRFDVETREKKVSVNCTIDEVYEVMRFSRMWTGKTSWSYTDGTFMEGSDRKNIFINEDIRFVNVTPDAIVTNISTDTFDYEIKGSA
jgi:hypothetical protein